MAAAADKTISTYVLLDLEATGLHGVGETPRIVEMCLIAVQRKHLLEENTACPRIMDKLVVCVNPRDKPMTCGASLITGIYNDVLEDLPVFDDRVVKMLTLFLSRLPQPVCLLAHNGNRFDFPMLKMELEQINQELPADILCGDTLEALRVIDPTRHARNLNARNGTNAVVTTSSMRSSTQTPQGAGKVSSGSMNKTGRGTGNECIDDEITPVRPNDNAAISFANPPGAPRKKRNFPVNTRHLGNMQAAKRRLLQDDSGGPQEGRGNTLSNSNNCNGGGFQLGTCASSPPPSPRVPVPRISVARRKLAFGNTSSHFSGGETPVTSSASALAKFQLCEELLPFPDNFSDEECDEMDAQENSDKEDSDISQDSTKNVLTNENVKEREDTNQNISDQTVHSNASCPLSTSNLSRCLSGGFEISESLPDDELIAEVDQIMSTASNQQAGDGDGRESTSCHDNATSGAVVHVDAVSDLRVSVVSVQCGANVSGNVALSTDTYSGQTTPTRLGHRQDPIHSSGEDNSNHLVNTKDSKNQANHSKQMSAPVDASGSGAMSTGNTRENTTTSSRSHTSRKSFKLTEIYKRVYGHHPQVSHTAEDDCITLLKIIKSCATKFGEWLDDNAVQFSDINKIY